MLTTTQVQQIRQLFTQADGLLIAAGAGMGVDSGLPDFRGSTGENQGMWKAYPALGQQRLDFSQIANPAAFRRDARLAWGFYGHRLNLYRQTIPHEGFSIIQEMAKQFLQGAFIFTSNVDGQFQKAGFMQEQVYECHGSLHHLQCMQPCCYKLWPAAELQLDIDIASCHLIGEVPRCPYCGGLARPNILMFADADWVSFRSDTQEHRLRQWLSQLKRPLVIELGAGLAVPTVRYFSEQFSPYHIRINPRDFNMRSGEGVAIPLGALQGLKFIQAALEG